MDIEDKHGNDAGSKEPTCMRPTVSTRRRLQNREAQRRYREKTAKKKPGAKSPQATDWTDMSLWDVDPGAEVNNGDTSVATDLNWEPHWSIDSTGPSSLSSSDSSSMSFYPSAGSIFTDADTPLMLDVDMISPHGGSSAMHFQGQFPLSENKSKHQLGVHHHSPSSSVMALHQSPSTGEIIHYSTSREQAASEPAGTLEEVQPLLHVAVRSRNCKMIAMLLQHGAAAVGDRNANGTTALHIATQLGDEAIVSLLLRYGADSSVRDVRGQDALHLAVSAGHTTIVELMLEKGKIAR